MPTHPGDGNGGGYYHQQDMQRYQKARQQAQQAQAQREAEFERTGLVDPNQAFQGDQGASELFGQLNRAQWADWKQRFAPYIQRLADRAQDPGAPQQTAMDARNAVGLAFDNSQQAQQMQNQGYGISMTPAQQRAQERRNSLQKNASMVTASNEARISEQDRQQAILAGGMGLSNIPDKVMNA